MKIKAYFTHLLGNAYSGSRNLLILCALQPTIVNNNFYISVHIPELIFFKELEYKKDKVLRLKLFEDILRVWFILFQPFQKFKKHRYYYIKTIHRFVKCHKLCSCLKYRNVPCYS